MRILVCGSGEFAVPSLRAIRAGRHEIVKVITQPARPAGRGGKLRPTPVFEAAGELGLEAREVVSINAPDVVAEVHEARPDVIFVADFGQMIRLPVRQCARLDTINLHASILPALRGAGPIRWAIVRGLAKTGVTTFSLVDKMDAGPVYLSAEIDILPEDTSVELSYKLAQIGADVTLGTLDVIEAGQVKPVPQDESLATLAPKMLKTDGLLDWTRDAVAIRNRIHGAWPWPGGQTSFVRKDGKEFDVTIARAVAEPFASAGETGVLDGELCVAAGSGRLRIVEIQPAGKRLMMWKDFANGYRASAGDRFVTKAPPQT